MAFVDCDGFRLDWVLVWHSSSFSLAVGITVGGGPAATDLLWIGSEGLSKPDARCFGALCHGAYCRHKGLCIFALCCLRDWRQGMLWLLLRLS